MALLAAYSFDESGPTVTDYSGNGQSFNLNASCRRASGHRGYGLQSTQDEVVGSVPLPALAQTDQRTVMFWLQEPANWTSSHFIFLWEVEGVGAAWAIEMLSDERIRVHARTASTYASATADYPADGQFHHVAAVFDGAAVKLYLDAELVAEAALVGTLRSDAGAPVLFEGYNSAVIDCFRARSDALDETSIVRSMNTPVEGNFGNAASLAVTQSFVDRCTAAALRAAAQVYGEVVALETKSGINKQRQLLAINAVQSPADYGQRFAWLIACDGSITGVAADVDDSTISVKVAELWNLVAGVVAG